MTMPVQQRHHHNVSEGAVISSGYCMTEDEAIEYLRAASVLDLGITLRSEYHRRPDTGDEEERWEFELLADVPREDQEAGDN
jgi:hypothetical protein